MFRRPKPIKILVFFAVHRRLEVLEVCLAGLERLKKYAPKRFAISTFAVCSAADESEILTAHKVQHVMASNDLLGAKKNAGLRAALGSKWDYLMEIGSDDLLTNAILDLYEPRFRAGVRAFGINTCYFYEVGTGRVARFQNRYAVGAGRCFRRDVFEDLPTPGEFWTPTQQRGMDGDSMKRLASLGIGVEWVEPSEPMCLDIKSGRNINSFDRFEPVELDVLRYFPDEAEAVRGLHPERVEVPVALESPPSPITTPRPPGGGLKNRKERKASWRI